MEEEEVEEERPRPGVIAELLAHPVYSLASQINTEHFEAVARRRAVSSRALHWPALLMSIYLPQWLAVVCRGRFSALLVQKLFRFRSDRAVKRALKHTMAVLSRRHFVGLKDRAATCVSTLQGHSGSVSSVAFHPSAPYLATGSWDNTAKLWQLSDLFIAFSFFMPFQFHAINLLVKRNVRLLRALFTCRYSRGCSWGQRWVEAPGLH
jgi:hypothetical protein